MKLQYLAVIFVIIVMPISIVLSEYTQMQIKNVSIQSNYDAALISASYDAMKAYQLNSINNSSNDIATSKLRDIEASVNTFLTSIKSHFNYSGDSNKTINDYIPAVVYTMYDGYYIYSPFNNDISNIYQQDTSEWATYQDNEIIEGVKPYIYYSCYYKAHGFEGTITYTLDNYITIQGTYNGDPYNKSGYFLDKVSKNGERYIYNGIVIEEEDTLTETIFDPDREEDENPVTYPYIKYDGTKYYYDGNRIFYFQNGEKNYYPPEALTAESFNKNNDAYNFYKNAYGFTQEVKEKFGSISFSDACDVDGNRINISGFNSNDSIFNGGIDAEDENSKFNIHRTAVIRYAIEKNLSIAIANYDRKFGGAISFSMPNLSEEDWYKLINKTSVITFLQGLPMGTRTYNGYAIVTNNKNREVVTNDSIYIVTNDINGKQYHRIDEIGLENLDIYKGYVNIDFERQTQDDLHYYYPRGEVGSYISIVSQTRTAQIDDINKYLSELSNPEDNKLAKAYYTALGRERYELNRSNAITQY